MIYAFVQGVTIRNITAKKSAIGKTTTPTLRKDRKLTSSPSRRIAVSHKMVAREPVIERLGPKSTPIRSASMILWGE